MKCKVISLIKVKQGNHLPYFIVRAIGIENEEDAEYLDEFFVTITEIRKKTISSY